MNKPAGGFAAGVIRFVGFVAVLGLEWAVRQSTDNNWIGLFSILIGAALISLWLMFVNKTIEAKPLEYKENNNG